MPQEPQPLELVLRVRVPPGDQRCAYAFAQRLFRPERCSWQGPALVNWFARWHSSGEPLDLADPDARASAYGDPSDEDEPPPTERARPRGSYRVHRIGEPVCLIVSNPGIVELEVELVVSGTSV